MALTLFRLGAAHGIDQVAAGLHMLACGLKDDQLPSRSSRQIIQVPAPPDLRSATCSPQCGARCVDEDGVKATPGRKRTLAPVMLLDLDIESEALCRRGEPV
jgi:hypothetical protein